MLTMQLGQKHKRAKGTGRRATLRTAKGALHVEVLGYEHPNAPDGPDADWLDVRLELEEGERHFSYEGGILLADELALWGERTKAIDGTARMFTFIEPNLAFAWSPPAIGGSRTVRVEIFCEASGGNARVDATLRATDQELRLFGRSLLRLARRFPVRSILIPWRVS